jgi:ABC-2 type transport system permease protein
MRKYLKIFTTSWQNEFTYRLNFILWRLRNVIRLLMTYFLWRGIYSSSVTIFGYSQNQMLSYVFLVLIFNAIVLSAPSADSIGGEIGSGDLSNYLLKPIGYLKYWFTRDLASKSLNLLFSILEIFLIWLVLRPVLSLTWSFQGFIGCLIALLLALPIYFFISASARFNAFWTPENTWGLSFLIIIFLEVLGGSIFPLDVLPSAGFILIQFTPFPYLVYFPIAIILGRITGLYLVRILVQSFIWALLLGLLTRYIWRRGLRSYSSSGR